MESKLQRSKSKNGSLARFKGGYAESWLEIKLSHDILICNGPFQPSILPAVWRALVMISPKLKSYAALE